jgi:hypothetical protein
MDCIDRGKIRVLNSREEAAKQGRDKAYMTSRPWGTTQLRTRTSGYREFYSPPRIVTQLLPRRTAASRRGELAG